MSVCLSLRPSIRLSAWNNWVSTGQLFRKFYIEIFFENLSRKFKLNQNLTRIAGTLRADLHTFMIIYRWILLRMRNISDKFVEKTKTHILWSITFFFIFENLAVYEIMWKDILKPDRPQMTIWRMSIACWIPDATNTHSEYVMLIALPLQQWLYERYSVLHYTYNVCFAF